eukprot:m.238521 g.238521  ORF g.238521 m.238521 type:complete len:225 (-) comp21828_c0_seq1:116-790(-)
MSDQEEETSELRAIGCETALLNRADGSARFWQGDTCVLASVVGPKEVSVRDEKHDQATIEVVFKPKVGLASIAEKSLEGSLHHVASKIIIGAQHPRSSISIVLQVISDDGSLLACAVNAMCLALLDAGVVLETCAAAASCVLNSVDRSITLDPTSAQEKAASAQLTMVFAKDPQNSLTLCTSRGAFDEGQFDSAFELVAAATRPIFSFYRKAMQRRLSKEHRLG